MIRILHTASLRGAYGFVLLDEFPERLLSAIDQEPPNPVLTTIGRTALGTAQRVALCRRQGRAASRAGEIPGVPAPHGHRTAPLKASTWRFSKSRTKKRPAEVSGQTDDIFASKRAGIASRRGGNRRATPGPINSPSAYPPRRTKSAAKARR